MPIPLNQNQSRPAVKLPTLGAGLEVCIVGTRQIPWTEFGTGVQKIGEDGRPRVQLRLTGIVVSAQGAVTGPQGQERPVQIGETVDLYLHGHQWFSFIEAERALNTAGLSMQVGDVLLQHYTHNEPASRPGAQDKRVKACTIRRARPDEAHFVAQAEAAYYALGFDRADPDAGQAPTQQAPQQQPYGASVGQPNGYGNQQPAYTPQPQAQPQQPAYAPQPQQGYAPQPQPQQPAYGQQAAPYGGGGNNPGF